jgi:hypothetical protein
MTRDQIERAVLTAATPQGRAPQHRRANGIEDYLFIRGHQMSAAQAAQRLGVTPRTIIRWRAVLRQAP